ncbi:MAG: hypothetical protein A2X59_11055 [Nitrospirae bacterium GWC2_42_7]|nr:MAG: hypothetical protein A2X59_11055 [Nitrospirae bacterium GWC2_42_7]
MPLDYKCFKNKNNGQMIYVEAGRFGNFKNSVKKLVSYIRYNIPRYYIAHLTLTVAENLSEIDLKDLHRVMQFISQRLKRAGSDFKYLAVKELQDRGAVHYHVLCIYSKPYVFPSSSEIASSWKLGFVKITAPKLRMKLNTIVGYIGKYIGKGYEYDQLEVKKSFTASQIKQIYKLSEKRLDDAMSRYGKKIAESLSCTYKRLFTKMINEDTGRTEVVTLYTYPSEWEYMGVYPEPF